MISKRLFILGVCALFIGIPAFAQLFPALFTHAEERNGDRSALPLLFVRDLEISRTRDQHFSGTFRIISQEEAAVGGVDYIIEILSPLPDIPEGELIEDDPLIYSREYVSANLSLSAKEERTIEFSHDHGPLLEGDYRVRIQLITSSGRYMGWWDEDIIIAGTTRGYIELRPISFLADSTDVELQALLEDIDREASEVEPFSPEDFPEQYREALEAMMNLTEEDTQALLHRSEWAPAEGPNVDPGAEVGLRAEFENKGTEAVTGTIMAHIRRDLTATTQLRPLVLGSISLTPGQQETRDIMFPAPTEPGVYEIFLSVENENNQRVSTIGEYRVVVRGPSASIMSVRAQELRLEEGEDVLLSIFAVGSADSETIVRGTLEVTMLDDNTSAGTTSTNVELGATRQELEARIRLDRTISGTPGARIVIRDEEDNVLDVYEVEFPRDAALTTAPEDAAPIDVDTTQVLILSSIVLAALLVLGGIGVYTALRKKENDLPPPPSGTVTMGLLLLPSMLVGAGIYFIPKADASHTDGMHSRYGIRVNEGVGNGFSTPGGGRFPRSIFINAPMHGQTVIPNEQGRIWYSASSSFRDTCNNRVGRQDTWAHLARNGGHFSSHTQAQWATQVSLSRATYSVAAIRAGVTRGISGWLNADAHKDAQGRTTVWTEAWWATMEGHVINDGFFMFLLTQFNVQDPTSTLHVRSRVDGHLEPGAAITRVAGTQGTGGTTPYAYAAPGSTNTTLQAPETHAGGIFSHWENCDSVTDRDCQVSVGAGNTRAVAAHYTAPPPSISLEGRPMVFDPGPNQSCLDKADFTGDGRVDMTDAEYIAERFFQECSEGNDWCEGADINRDGRVDLGDLLIVSSCSGVDGYVPVGDFISAPGPVEVSEEDRIQLRWTVDFAESCQLTASGGLSVDKSVDIHDTDRSDRIIEDTTFELVCTGPGGQSSETLEVVVAEDPPQPVLHTTTFQIAGPDGVAGDQATITEGQTATLTWSTAPGADACIATDGTGDWAGTRDGNGTHTASNVPQGAYTFSLQCERNCAWADRNGDGNVTLGDWLQLTSCVGKNVSEHPECAWADRGGSGIVDNEDVESFAECRNIGNINIPVRVYDPVSVNLTVGPGAPTPTASPGAPSPTPVFDPGDFREQ
jgi:hypothetical protein